MQEQTTPEYTVISTIAIKLKDRVIELTSEEARIVYKELGKLLEQDKLSEVLERLKDVQKDIAYPVTPSVQPIYIPYAPLPAAPYVSWASPLWATAPHYTICGGGSSLLGTTTAANTTTSYSSGTLCINSTAVE